MKKKFNVATIIGLMLLVAVITFTITYLTVERQFQEQLAIEKSRDDVFNKLGKIVDIIDEMYIGEYDPDDLIDGAAYGLVAATGDRWSYYMNEEDYASYKDSIMNQYVGIGVTVTFDEDNQALVIAKVHTGSPAEAAGLKVRDMIVGVDGQKVSDLGYDGTVSKVRGEENTPVVLEIMRGTTAMTREIVRKSYLYNPVSSKIISDNIGYIKIDNFDSRVDVSFEDALGKLLDANVDGLIFDVRGNPGGLKNAMVNMLDLLCPEGVLFTMRDKNGVESIDYSAPGQVDLPMVVIIDENSYSAAEFFAAALREYDKAEIVGTSTFGKGYSQITLELGDGSAINLSTNEYFTPNGESLIGVGVTPDHYVELGFDGSFLLLDEKDDPQLQKAIEVVALNIALAKE
ncbi:MAG: S41 family peptidase [Clostridiales bacterium]|jgi:carboxyl-terminal processing protease|nr:S41 family peptidase [Clostridiales bacterium]